MATPPEPSSGALQASARVFTDPMLWRCISSFQRGLPVPLFAFWVAQDPWAAHSTNRDLVFDNIDRLIERVVQFGPPELLKLVPHVRYYHQDQWKTPSLQRAAEQAIRAYRPEMLEWVIVNNHVVQDTVVELWRLAITQHERRDMRVLEMLNLYKPIEHQEMRGLTSDLTHTALVGWIDERYPGALDTANIMANAVADSYSGMVQYLHEHFPTENFGARPYVIAHTRGRIEILVYLLKKRPQHAGLKLVERLITEGDPKILAALKGASVFEDPARKFAAQYIKRGDTAMLQRLCDLGWFDHGAPLPIDQAAAKGCLDFIKFLVERNLATATTDAMDLAAEAKQWDVVYFLHENGIAGCTTRVMDAAAAQGEMDHLQFFHENQSEGCTTRAMDDAASEGDLAIVCFLHENRSEGCTTRAMDAAAKHDQFPVVQFLHLNRFEGCTTDAMDKAAKRGNLRVVEFLHTHRSEGCTQAAVVQAAECGYVDVVRFLYKHYRSYFGPELLHTLLLRGVFDVWMELRVVYPDEANAVVEPVLFEAGKSQELATIRFIIQELGREDLAHIAVDGASTAPAYGKPDWLRAVVAIAGPQSCRLSAIQNAVKSSRGYYPALHIQYLISICCESGARELVISIDHDTSHIRYLIKQWDPKKQPLELPPLHPILADGRCPPWAVRNALKGSFFAVDPHGRLGNPVPWAAQAIYMNNRALLDRLLDLGASIAESFTGNKREFTFEGARGTAVRVGSLSDLQMLVKNLKLPVEPTLLDEALSYHQFEVAEWLVEHCRAGCQELPRAASTDVWWLADGIVLNWIESHPAVRELIDFDAIAYQSAECGNLLALEKLHTRYPELFTTRNDLAKAARENDEHKPILDFLAKIQYKYLQ